MKRKYAAIVLSMAMVLSPVGVLAADNTAEATETEAAAADDEEETEVSEYIIGQVTKVSDTSIEVKTGEVLKEASEDKTEENKDGEKEAEEKSESMSLQLKDETQSYDISEDTPLYSATGHNKLEVLEAAKEADDAAAADESTDDAEATDATTDDAEAADGFKDDNPLVNSSNYRVYMNNIEKQSELVAYIKTLDNVREVNQSEQAAKTLGSINRIVSYVSVAVIVILLLIAIFLISNTISVGITVRKDEIGIMKYIGATDAFVRAPFLLEGMILGLIGAGIPLIILYFCYNNVVTYVYTKFSVLMGVVDFIPVGQIYQTLVPVALALGIGIGLVGSFITTRKHLKV